MGNPYAVYSDKIAYICRGKNRIETMKRINKYITDAGYCSRRKADWYVEQGRVTINGVKAVLGSTVSDTDRVQVDGELVGGRKKKAVYIVLNKPVGVTCTTDQRDKTNIVDYVGYKERIFPVGRLDKDSEGLIILTNDGDIVNKILRAGNNNPKEYVVTVNRPITDDFLDKMGKGVRILGTTTKPCYVSRKNNTTFIIHLTQGLNRQIRRMCQVFDYEVVKLKRIKVMNIPLGDLKSGRWRHLTPEEATEMHRLLALSSGTEEASNEKQVKKPVKSVSVKSFKGKPTGSFDDDSRKSFRKNSPKPSSVSRRPSKNGEKIQKFADKPTLNSGRKKR